MGLGWAVVGVSSLIGLAVLLVGMIMFALRWLGGGDAKLFAAVALWMGLDGVLPFVLFTGLAGGLFSLLLITARSWLQIYRLRLPAWGQRLLQRGGDIPYGVAIAIGALCAYPTTEIVRQFVFI